MLKRYSLEKAEAGCDIIVDFFGGDYEEVLDRLMAVEGLGFYKGGAVCYSCSGEGYGYYDTCDMWGEHTTEEFGCDTCDGSGELEPEEFPVSALLEWLYEAGKTDEFFYSEEEV
jgi:hypothetical protein